MKKITVIVKSSISVEDHLAFLSHLETLRTDHNLFLAGRDNFSVGQSTAGFKAAFECVEPDCPEDVQLQEIFKTIFPNKEVELNMEDD